MTMRLDTQTIDHDDGRMEVRRIFDGDNMLFWDSENPLAYEKSIVWFDEALDMEYVRFALIRNARSRRGPLVLTDPSKRILGYAKLTADAPHDRSDEGYARRVFYLLSDDMEREHVTNGMVHPVSRCVDPRTVLPTVLGQMPRCNQNLQLSIGHLNSAEQISPTVG
jgi:hypothetical protein